MAKIKNPTTTPPMNGSIIGLLALLFIAALLPLSAVGGSAIVGNVSLGAVGSMREELFR
jgi:hypothetical protein